MISAVDRLPTAAFTTDEAGLRSHEERIETFIDDTVTEAGADGVVVGMSGGVDSTLTATLAVEALGPDRVTALVLPSLGSGDLHIEDAEAAAADLGVDATTIGIRPLVDMFEDIVAPRVGDDTDDPALDNATARLRMTCLYYAANHQNRLVVGTSNRTELLCGYCTKHGDAAADLRPLAGLYKTEVRALASAVGVPSRIIQKPSTADFRPGQTDESDLGAPYGLLDIILHKLIDENLGIEGTADELGLSPETIATYADRHLDSRHKRCQPPGPSFGRARDGELFHELEHTTGRSETWG